MPDTNSQIIDTLPEKNCCALVFVRTLFFTIGQQVENDYLITSSDEIINKASKIITNFYPECELNVWKNNLYVTGNTFNFIKDLDFENLFNLNAYEDCCALTILKTLFLTYGKLYFVQDSNKNSKGYNLEFVCKNGTYQVLTNLLTHFNFKLKTTKRQNNYIIYTKNSALICDLLVLLGAVYASLEVQNSLAMREIRNLTNRQNNCFENNINKTINASEQQLEAISYIIDNYTIDYLDDNLKEVALVRLANPEISLDGLRTLLKNKISRAGIKYRLDKIISIYKSLKGEN